MGFRGSVDVLLMVFRASGLIMGSCRAFLSLRLVSSS